ncbi:unnamed protein product [Adineta ricciae]|uniref:Uncharacterized protein n=2 Tax=Adineta ricciae TaxID=249248 RepID=A0A813MV95_ADIRI|nr:unnamed protein product [Adineta ricciae]
MNISIEKPSIGWNCFDWLRKKESDISKTMATNPNQFLTVPSKKAFDVNVSTPIKNFIKTMVGDKEDYSASVDGLNSLRAEALLRSNYKDDCSKLLRYYDQICAIEHKLPITENQIRIYFKWQDGFVSGGSLFGSKQKTNGSWKLAYEKACVLFNIGHAYSELALAQNLSIDDQMKTALRYFQLASGVFSFLKDYVNANSLSDLSVDFEPAVLASMSWLMLAQAAELIYLKSASLKDDIAAKVAAHAADCYKEAYTSSKTESAKKIIPENYINIMFVKHLLFQSKTEYHAGNQAQADRKYGLKVARYEHAKDFADQAVSKCTIAAFTPALRANQDEVNKALTAAKKDNDFVYHERVPDVKTLEVIIAQPIAKPLPVTFPITPDFRDLFASLVPIALNNALAAFSSKRAEIMNIEINRLREATNVLNSLLASLNLPAAIEDRGGRDIPPSVAEKSNEIKRQGGINTLDKMINDLPESLQRNKEILDEANRMLDDEERGDTELRNQFKERWTRTISSTLTVPLREEAKKYMDIIQNAINADRVVQEKYRMNRDCIVLLSKQTHELAGELPSATAAGALRDSFSVRELQRLMETVAAIKAEREVMESELKNTDSDGVRARLVAAFHQGSHNDENSIVVHEIESIYTPLRQQITESVSKQEQLVENIRRAHQQFQNEKQGNESSAIREEMLKNLARAYDAFQELLSNLREGTKFYNDLTPLLLKFQNKVSDFVFARKTEKEDLMKDIQRGIVGGNQPTTTASTQQAGANPYAASAAPPYPQSQQPSAPPTGGPPPTTTPDGSSLPYPGAYMQPFFPMPPGYNPYNPFFNMTAPAYPMAGATQYPQQGYGVEKPQSAGATPYTRTLSIQLYASSLLYFSVLSNPTESDMAAVNPVQTQWHTFQYDHQEFKIPVRYQNPTKIGQGAFGAVIRLTDTTTGRTVAIKKLIKPFRGEPVYALRAYRELIVLLQLKYPNAHIAQLLDVFTPDQSLQEFQTFYLVMKDAGLSLSDYIKTHQLTEAEIKKIIYSILRGLKLAHSAHIIHRDLKPSNIGIDPETLYITILDFGLARVASSEIQTGYVQTRWWRAPEVYANWERYDDKLDTWSIGCILGELIVREPIVPGKDYVDHLKKILKLIGTPDETTLREICTPEVAAFILSLTSEPGKDFNTLYGYKYAEGNLQPVSGVSPHGVDLLHKLLSFDHRQRPTAAEALAHPFFDGYHLPTGEPTANTIVDQHQDATYPVDTWKKIIWEIIQNAKINT